MQRLLVTGNAGSGKSTLAVRLGELLGLDVVGLDRVVWRPGWQKTPPDERRAAELEIAACPAWVVDGVSRVLMEAADLVVFLDLDRHICLGRCLRRNAPYLFRSRPGLPERCPELHILPTLLRLIWQFPAQTRPWILAARQGDRRFVHLRSAGEVRVFVAVVEAQGAGALLEACAAEPGLSRG